MQFNNYLTNLFLIAFYKEALFLPQVLMLINHVIFVFENKYISLFLSPTIQYI